MTGWIGITIGDPMGVGPEVTLKALAAAPESDLTRFLVIGDTVLLSQLNRRLGSALPLRPFGDKAGHGRYFVENPLPKPLSNHLRPGAPEAAQAAIAWLADGARRCLCGELDALVTAPINKEAVIRAGQRFTGQTEFLSEIAKTKRTAMMLLGVDDRGRWLRVALATTHVPIKLVAGQLTQAKIEDVIELSAEACQKLCLGRARIGVCGLNPHAGEGGKLGTEEISIIAPAVQAMQKRGIEVVGPLAADTLFFQAYRGDFEVVVAMYHDQGLAPLKMIGFETGVNWTLGLPFVRTSPDHGTAYDIAGQGKASAASMQAAIRLAQQLASKR
jgi:4-hydroxythreonine-4-phosphate dehydrogenase